MEIEHKLTSSNPFMNDIIFLRKHSPRWLVLLGDIVISFVSVNLAYFVIYNFWLSQVHFNLFLTIISVTMTVRISSFLLGRTYAGIIRYTSTKDAGRIFLVLSAGSVFLLICNQIRYIFFDNLFFVPTSVIFVDFLINIFFMIASRLVIKTLYYELNNSSKSVNNVIIYGASEFGAITKKTLDREDDVKYNIIAFVDDYTKGNEGKKIDGITIYNADKLELLLQKQTVHKLIFAQKNIEPQRKQEIIEICLNYSVKVLNVPEVVRWTNGELSSNQMRNVNIEDLLERPPIRLDEMQISKEIYQKNIMVTGAAGSIGSEIVKQLIRFNPAKIIVFDQAESALYDLELELSEKYHFHNIEIVIGDITNYNRMNHIFRLYRPAIVYHAAAYKHVPMMERHPSEAIHTNVYGTKTIADLSLKYKVSKFVMISTDKAVNPTNVMGCSKRIAEIYTQSLNSLRETKFITTRFGNVLGSNGSVIPRFKKQLEEGGPVTVTHPEITRYFMTIPEACQLVLEASAMGKGGEIFIFDMGKSVKIVDLAKKMIKLYGLQLGKDIQIYFTGLRPGEKLYEELLNDKENTVPTHHEKIMVGKVRKYDLEIVNEMISQLLEILKTQDYMQIVSLMKRIVPEFKSKNSIYEALDTPKESDDLSENDRDNSKNHFLYN